MKQPFCHQFNAMTTGCELQCYGLELKAANRLAQAIEARVEELVRKYNFHNSGSWLNTTINQRQKAAVDVDDECAKVLEIVRQHSVLTSDAFDIAVGTLNAARKRASSLEQVTDMQRELFQFMGTANWQLHGRTLHFNNPHTRFDLGGVIKEYAVDQCLEMIRDTGAYAALVNFGGDLRCFGKKPDGSRFVAAVQDPKNPDRILFALDLDDQALTTSGHYARSRKLSDGELSHVIGRSNESDQKLLSATVISSSALISGIYSTSLLLNPNVSLPVDVFAVTVDGQGKISQRFGSTLSTT